MLIRLATWIGLTVAALSAAPIQYTITFTKTSGTAPAPTGGFVYDAAAPLGSQFSNFNLTWGTVTVDMLTEPGVNANNPLASLTSCVPGTSAGTFLMLSGPLPCDSSAQLLFAGRVDPGATSGIISFFSSSPQTDLQIVGRGDQAFPFGDCESTEVGQVGPGCVFVQGTATISPVPEPATGVLMLFAIAITATVRRRLL
jgi:hypothetical protein